MCKSDPDLRAARGCGERPTLSGKSWDSDSFLVDAIKRGLSGTDLVTRAHQAYAWADFGGIHTLTGEFWPHCPAWYARFYEGPMTVRADAAIELAVFVKRGFGPMLAAGGHRWSRSELLFAIQAQSMIDHLNNEAQEREMERIRNKGRDKK